MIWSWNICGTSPRMGQGVFGRDWRGHNQRRAATTDHTDGSTNTLPTLRLVGRPGARGKLAAVDQSLDVAGNGAARDFQGAGKLGDVGRLAIAQLSVAEPVLRRSIAWRVVGMDPSSMTELQLLDSSTSTRSVMLTLPPLPSNLVRAANLSEIEQFPPLPAFIKGCRPFCASMGTKTIKFRMTSHR